MFISFVHSSLRFRTPCFLLAPQTMKSNLIICFSFIFFAHKCMMGCKCDSSAYMETHTHEQGHQMVMEFVHHQPLVTKYKICYAEKGEHMKESTFSLFGGGDLMRSVESYRDTGRSGWGPARWPTERAAEALAPDLPSSVRHADYPRHRRLLCESPPGKQKDRDFQWRPGSCLDSVLELI